MKVLAAYRRVLSNGPLARLLAGEFVSSIGDWLYLVALLIVIYEQAADPLTLGIVGASRILPYILLSIPAGIAADRFDRRLILLVTDVARGVIMVLMAIVVAMGGSVAAIVALAILATCFSAFFSPAIGTYIPSLVRDESELGPANTTWSTLDNLAFIIGPAIAGLLIAVGGLGIAFVLNAVSFAVVALVLWRLPPSRAGGTSEAVEGGPSVDSASDDPSAIPTATLTPATDRTTVRSVLRSIRAPLAGLALLNVVGSFVTGGVAVLTVVVAVDRLGSGDTGTGLLNAAVGIGGVLGALVATGLVLRRRQAPPLLLGGIVMAAGVAILGGADVLAVAMLAMAASSAGGLLVDIVSTTLFQRIVPDEVRGRVLGILETGAVTAYAIGSFALPVSVGLVGLGATLVGSGVAVAVSVLLAIPLLGRYAIQALPEDEVRRSLASVPIFGSLPPARLEAAMEAATVVRAGPGTRIVEQGAVADRFYVISDGLVEVTQRDGVDAPERSLRRLGPAEVFGEIGLLRGGIRTASVTAVSGTTLLALEREDFLELVSAGPGLTSRLLDLHRGATSVGAPSG